MKMTYDHLSAIVVDSIETALGVSEEELVSVEESPVFDFGLDPEFDLGVDVEVEFDEPFFMHPYYAGSFLSMIFNVTGDSATVHVFIGLSCSNPELANEFVDLYMDSTQFKDMWKSSQMCDAGDPLVLETSFSFESEAELSEELANRLALFTDERFTNELRPFIHYFED